ncbi:protease B nonderepressible form [Mortierella sp. AD094]|nr:protease B nonderepressible form [Mortierella sp. AD094]
MLAEFLRQSLRGMKAPTEVYPLVAVVSGASIGGTYMAFRKLVTDPHLRTQATRTPSIKTLLLATMLTLSISAAALLAVSAIASVSAQSNPSTLPLLQHRHSFISTLPDEPSDDNLKVSRHSVEVVGLNGFREWDVKGSLRAFSAAAGKSHSEAINNKRKIHMQWYDSRAPLLRPPFTPTFVPGFHLAITSDDYSATWKEYCPILEELVGAMDCQDYEDVQYEDQGILPVRSTHLIPIYNHHYVHRTLAPPGFLPSSSVVSTLISKQHSGSLGPVLIDLVLQDGNANLKATWPVGNGNQEGGQETIKVSFNEQTDKVVEVGWFYREITEKEHTVYDHYLGATVKMDAQGEVVSEALVQSRSPVFPPHKREASTGKVHTPGHGFSSAMSPAQTFHPHSITTIQSNPYIAETTSNCDLHILQVLPPGIFVDPFQLESLAPEIGQASVFGEMDLEKPVGVVSGWGSLVLVKAQPEESIKTSRWIAGDAIDSVSENDENDNKGEKSQASKPSPYTSTVDIPMHMRYQPPVPESDPATHVNVSVPWPIVAWVCPASDASGDNSSSSLAAKKLFHVPPLPLSLLFPSNDSKDSVNFRFLLPDPIPKHFPESHVSVPVGRLEDMQLVQMSTFALAGLGTVAVAFYLIKTVLARSSEKGKLD